MMTAASGTIRDGLYVSPSRINEARHPWISRAISDRLREQERLRQSCWVRSHATRDKRRVYSLLTISQSFRTSLLGKEWPEPTRFLGQIMYQDETKSIFREEQYKGRVVVRLDGASVEEWGPAAAAPVVFDAVVEDDVVALSVSGGSRDLTRRHPVHPEILKLRIFVRTGRTQVVVNFMGSVGANGEQISLLKTVMIVLRSVVAVPGAVEDLGFSSVAMTPRHRDTQAASVMATGQSTIDEARDDDRKRVSRQVGSLLRWAWSSVTCRYAGLVAVVVIIGWVIADTDRQIISQLLVAMAGSFLIQLRWAARVRTTASIKFRSLGAVYREWLESAWRSDAAASSVEVGRLRRLWRQRPRWQYERLVPSRYIGGDEAKRARQMLGLIVWGLLVAVLYLLLGELKADGDGGNLPWIWQQAESTLIAVTIIITVATSGLIGLYQAVQQQTAAFRVDRQRLIAELLAPLASLDKLAEDRWEAFHEQLHDVGESFMYLANQVWAAEAEAADSAASLAPRQFLSEVVTDGTAQRDHVPQIAGGLADAWVLSDDDKARLGVALQVLTPRDEVPLNTVWQRTAEEVLRADEAFRRVARGEELAKSDQRHLDRMRWLLSLVPESDHDNFVGFYPSSTDLTYLFVDALFFDARTKGWWVTPEKREMWIDEARQRIEEFTTDVGQDSDEEDLLEWLDDAQEKATQLGLDWSNLLDDLFLFNDLKLKANLLSDPTPRNRRAKWLCSQWIAYAAAYHVLITRPAPPALAAPEYWPGLPSLKLSGEQREEELSSSSALEMARSWLERTAKSVRDKVKQDEDVSWSERLLLIEDGSRDGILFNWMRAIKARQERKAKTMELLEEMESLAREGIEDQDGAARVEVLGIVLEEYRTFTKIGQELRVIAQPTVLNRGGARDRPGGVSDLHGDRSGASRDRPADGAQSSGGETVTSLLSVESLAHQRFVTALVPRMIRDKTRWPLGWDEVERPEQWSGPDRDEKAERLYAVASKLRSLVYGRVDNTELKKAINEALEVRATGVATRSRWSHLAQLVVLAQGSDLEEVERDRALDRYFRRADVVKTWGLLEDDATEVSLNIPAIVGSLKVQKAEPDLSERFRQVVEPHHKEVTFFNLPDLKDKKFVNLLTNEWAKLDEAMARSCAEPWERVDEVTVRIARELRTMDVLLSRSQVDTIVYFLTYRATGALGRQPFFRDYEQYRGRLSGSSLREGMNKYRKEWIEPRLPPESLEDWGALSKHLDDYEAKLPAPTASPPSEVATTDT
jgi:hypothetical protein